MSDQWTRRPNCACGHPWYVHRGQVRSPAPVVVRGADMDCASCYLEGRACSAYVALASGPVPSVQAANPSPDEDPPIPDDPT